MSVRMLFRLLSLLVMGTSLMLCGIACGNTSDPAESEKSASDTETVTQAELPEAQRQAITYPLRSETLGVKILGVRNGRSQNSIQCDWTCSGVEFYLRHEGGSIVFDVLSNGSSYFRVFVDGEAWKNEKGSLYYEAGRSIRIPDVPAGAHHLRVIKVTGYTLSRAQLRSVTFCGELLSEPIPGNDLYIEWVGDSISCGWGVIGNHQGAYSDQDGALAYPYLVSQGLSADYAVTALSGQGLLCGNPGVTQGYLYTSPLRSMEDAGLYAFSRQADVVVINIGTNDYTKSTAEAFLASYLSFLQTVKEKNGSDCKILCLYNTMNDTHSASILSACAQMGGQEKGIYTLKLKRTASVYTAHPTAEENAAYATVIADYLKETVLK